MKVLILTRGTYGDVLPYVALAKGLVEVGHEVTLCAPASSASIECNDGIDVVPLDDVARKTLGDPEARKLIMAKGGVRRVRKMATYFKHVVKPQMARQIKSVITVAERGTDIIVHHPLAPGRMIAEHLEVPSVVSCLQPAWVPTKLFPNPFLPAWPDSAMNRHSYRFNPLHIRMEELLMERLCKAAGLPGSRAVSNRSRLSKARPSTVLHAFSQHALPSPLDYPDWVHTVGFWFVSPAPDWKPPRDVIEFLDAGDTPVYIGFGSMVGVDPRHTGHLVAEAIRLAGVRAVVAPGWGGIDTDGFDENVLVIDHIPHSWLFPRMSAVVHHGGAGTTAAALASGRPQVVCPFVDDQTFNARRMHVAGVSTSPLPQKQLSAELLACAIRRVLSDRIASRRARELGRLVCTEDGVAKAVGVLEAELRGRSRPT